jgi:hypothetical protein
MQIKTSTALAIFAIVMAIALVTAGSLTTSAFAAKTKKHTRHGGTGSTSTVGTTTGTSKSSTSTGKSSTSTGLSKFISCVRAVPTLTRADAVNCYNTVFSPGFGSAGSTAGAGTSIGSGTGSSAGSTAGAGTSTGHRHTGIGSGTGSSAGSTAGSGTVPGFQ